MKQRLFVGVLVIILVGLIPAASLAGNWWDKFGEPQYGGELTSRTASLDMVSFDPAAPKGPSSWKFWSETLFLIDWALDREIWPYNVGFIPAEYTKGLLAESWEQTDPKTITIHIRKGIHWQDKPPVNGREFTAEDVKYNYDRLLGTGSGFTKANPFFGRMAAFIASVDATDKYTVVFRLKQPNPVAIYQIFGGIFAPTMVPPEWVKESDTGDWKSVVGTGPWVLTEFVKGNSLTFKGNPNYWATDDRYPKNKIPYVDTHTVLAIPDTATAVAALRTGRIDEILDMRGGLSLQDAQNLAKTHPDIQQGKLPNPPYELQLRVDNKPFTDIRVRKALQMSINRDELANAYYQGTTTGTPSGMTNYLLKGYVVPFEEWPADLRGEYSYNPSKAKQLLAEAGYPNGFETTMTISSQDDAQLAQIVLAYFKDIGVDCEIEQVDAGSFQEYVTAGKHKNMALSNRGGGGLTAPWDNIFAKTSKNMTGNYTHNNDPVYDKMVADVTKAPDMSQVLKLSMDADIYAISQHWGVALCTFYRPIAWQPYVKGYSGELPFGDMIGFYRARMWIDQGLKKSMGR